MAKSSDRPGKTEDRADERLVRPPSDLIDFYRRWPEFRASAAALAERRGLSPIERATVKWLIVLADRIGDHDLGPKDGKRRRTNKRLK
jgi:hypothetical protein